MNTAILAQDWYIHPFAGPQIWTIGGSSFNVAVGHVGFPNSIDNSGMLYGARGGHKITSALTLEGGFRFTLGERTTSAALVEQDLSVAPPLAGSDVLFYHGGNVFLSDLGIKWRLSEGTFSPFLYGGAGSATRTGILSREDFYNLGILANALDKRVMLADLGGTHTHLHIDAGVGLEIRTGRKFDLRIEFRDRIEPNSFPGAQTRHFPEITAGPVFRF